MGQCCGVCAAAACYAGVVDELVSVPSIAPDTVAAAETGGARSAGKQWVELHGYYWDAVGDLGRDSTVDRRRILLEEHARA